MGCKLNSESLDVFRHLYEMADPFRSRPLRGQTSDSLKIEDEIALLKSLQYPKEPLTVTCAMGGSPKDFVWTTGRLWIIHQRIADTLTDHEISGWTTYPARLFDKAGEEVPEYVGIAITGRCGPVDWARSRPYWSPPLNERAAWSPLRRGMYFDPQTWDGSDVFMCNDQSTHVFVNEKLKNLIMKMRFSNVRFEALYDLETLIPISDLHLYPYLKTDMPSAYHHLLEATKPK